MDKKTNTFVLLALGLLVVVVLVSSKTGLLKTGQAQDGIAARVATTSAQTIGLSSNTIFATSTSCSSRIITTTAKPIMLTFTDRTGSTPTGTFGHTQSASTTVTYDASIYGCDAVKAIGFDATSNITTTETR